MTDWGRKMFVTPGVVVDGKLVTTDLVEINLGIRILLGSSFYDDWEDQEIFVTQRSARQPGRPAPPLEPAHPPAAAEARLRRQVQLGDVAALVRRHRTTCRSTPAAARSPACGRRRWPGLVDIGYVKATGTSVEDQPAEDRDSSPRSRSSGRSRSGATRSSATARAPTSRPTRRAAPCTSSRRRSPRSTPAAPRPGSRSRSRTRRSAAASPRRCAACCRTTW